MSAPPAPFPGHPGQAPPSAAVIQPVPVAGARPKRTGLIAGGIALAVVLVLGVVALVVILRPDDESGNQTGSGSGSGDRSVSVNRTMFSSGGQSVTLASLAVIGDKLRVNMRYENRSSVAWNLVCPAEVEDLRSSWVTVSGRTVYPDDSWCVQTHPGQGVTIEAGQSVDSWARYPVVPDKDASFSLQWYNLPAVSGLKV
jgi:hypothetical protein